MTEEETLQKPKSRAAYHREWNKRNKDKLKATQERYWRKRVLRELQAEQDQKIEVKG